MPAMPKADCISRVNDCGHKEAFLYPQYTIISAGKVSAEVVVAEWVAVEPVEAKPLFVQQEQSP